MINGKMNPLFIYLLISGFISQPPTPNEEEILDNIFIHIYSASNNQSVSFIYTL